MKIFDFLLGRKVPAMAPIAEMEVHEPHPVEAPALSICDPNSGENRWLRLVAQMLAARPEFDWFEGMPWPRAECQKMLMDGTMPDEQLKVIADRLNTPFSVLACFDLCTIGDLKYAFAQKFGVQNV